MAAPPHNAIAHPGAAVVGPARWLARAPIIAYRLLIGPALPRRCRYEPTCSRYALQAIDSYGAARGLVLALWRLLRCNPWSYGGYDPVDAQRLFARRVPHATHATRVPPASGARPDVRDHSKPAATASGDAAPQVAPAAR